MMRWENNHNQYEPWWKEQGRFHHPATPGGRQGSIDDFWTLDPTQKLINTLTKRKIWAKSKNSHTQIGFGKNIYLLILFSTLLTNTSLLFLTC